MTLSVCIYFAKIDVSLGEHFCGRALVEPTCWSIFILVYLILIIALSPVEGSLDSWCCECSSLLVFNGMSCFQSSFLTQQVSLFPWWLRADSVRTWQLDSLCSILLKPEFSAVMRWRNEVHRCSQSATFFCHLYEQIHNWIIHWFWMRSDSLTRPDSITLLIYYFIIRLQSLVHVVA